MSMERRIECLESEIEKASEKNEPGPSWRTAILLCKEVENWNRGQEGLSRIPLTPEEEV
jgi:hypothetical protein